MDIIIESKVKKEFTGDLQCLNCGHIFGDVDELQKHRDLCQFACKTCHKEESSLEAFESHLQDHGGFKYFKCILCQETFTFLWELNSHLPSHLPEEKFEDDHVSYGNSPLDDVKVEEEFINPHETFDYVPEDSVCEKKVSSVRKLIKNATAHKGRCAIKKPYTGRKRGRPKKGEQRIVPDPDERRFSCPQCTHTSKTFSNMKKHIQTHSGTKAFECAECGNRYSDKYALRDHLLMRHVQMKKLSEICPHCGKGFKLRKGLSVHIRTQHLSKEQCTCPICGKIYASKNSVDLHIRTHTSQPGCHACPKCGKSFDRRDLMLQHHRHIHVAPKKFQCTWGSCSFQSVTQGAFVLHQRKHTGEKPFQCGVCDKLFKSKSAVSLHTTHMHKPPTIQCAFCEKIFKLQSALRNHIRRIHQERKLPCPFCEKKYGFKADLTRHVRNSHSIKTI